MNTSHHQNIPPTDPRGRGFRNRSTVESVQSLISKNVNRLSSEKISTARASGRVLAEDIVASVNVPQFSRAAMDGYALKATETFGSDLYSPALFKVIGRSRPGVPFHGVVQPGQAVAIATGAPIPDGADAVIPVEATEIDHSGSLKVSEAVTPGRHIGQVGEDIRAGTTLLTTGRQLRPQDLGLLSAIGQVAIQAVRQPRVAILVTGDELLPAFSNPSGSMISDMNSPMLESLVRHDGGLVAVIGPESDNAGQLQSTIESLARSNEIDAVFINGGSSTGPEDHAPQIIQKLGTLLAHGVALRPASPTGFGLLNGKPVLLTPGNPVSCLCAYDFFGGLIVRRLAGRSGQWPYPQKVGRLAHKISSSLGRVDYVRVKYHQGEVEPIATSGASILSSTSRADGFVVVPADLEGYPAGADLNIWLYDIP